MFFQFGLSERDIEINREVEEVREEEKGGIRISFQSLFSYYKNPVFPFFT